MKTGNLVLSMLGAIIRVALVVLVVVVIYKGALACYDFGYRVFAEPAISPEGAGREVTVTVTEEMKAEDIGNLFLSKGLIRDAKLFILQYNFSEYKDDVKPGTFLLSTDMTVEEMMKTMTVVPEVEEADQISNGQVLPEEGVGEIDGDSSIQEDELSPEALPVE